MVIGDLWFARRGFAALAITLPAMAGHRRRGLKACADIGAQKCSQMRVLLPTSFECGRAPREHQLYTSVAVIFLPSNSWVRNCAIGWAPSSRSPSRDVVGHGHVPPSCVIEGEPSADRTAACRIHVEKSSGKP